MKRYAVRFESEAGVFQFCGNVSNQYFVSLGISNAESRLWVDL